MLSTNAGWASTSCSGVGAELFVCRTRNKDRGSGTYYNYRTADGPWTKVRLVDQLPHDTDRDASISCLAVGGKLHAWHTHDKRHLHIVRSANDDSWSRPYCPDDSLPTFNVLPFSLSGEMHVVLTDDGNQSRHIFCNRDGIWQPTENISEQVGQVAHGGRGDLIVIAPTARQAHLVTNTVGGLRFCTRSGNGVWGALTPVRRAPEVVVWHGCTGVGDKLHLVVATESGRIYTVHFDPIDGWSNYLGLSTDIRFGVRRVISIGPEIHVCCLSDDGRRLFHCYCNKDGYWYPFAPVQLPHNGSVAYTGLGLASVADKLHVLLVRDGILSHGFRENNKDGYWHSFSDLAEWKDAD